MSMSILCMAFRYIQHISWSTANVTHFPKTPISEIIIIIHLKLFIQFNLFPVFFHPMAEILSHTHSISAFYTDWIITHPVGPSVGSQRRMKTSLGESGYWTLFMVSRTWTSIPVHVLIPLWPIVMALILILCSCLSISSSCSSHLLDWQVHWVPLFTVMAWERFFSDEDLSEKESHYFQWKGSALGCSTQRWG